LAQQVFCDSLNSFVMAMAALWESVLRHWLLRSL
jgi:hypothetical protein